MLINTYSVYYVPFSNIFQKEVIKELIYADNMCKYDNIIIYKNGGNLF